MSNRATFDHQLQELSDQVVEMASRVDKAIARSMESLRVQNVALAEDVYKSDNAINQMHRLIEDSAITIIATQAPVSRDLRRVSSAMSIASNLERMGDYASGIAKLVMGMGTDALIKPLVDLPRMSQIAREMLDESITAFIELDDEMARRISTRDDEVDQLYDDILIELLEIMRQDPETIKGATRLLWVCHNVERIADRVTNICERTVFISTGEFVELDGGRGPRQKFSRNGSSDHGIDGLD